MKFRLSVSGIAGNIRQAIAIIGLAESTTNTINLPANIRSIMFTISGVLLVAEHFIDGLQPILSSTPMPAPIIHVNVPTPISVVPPVAAVAPVAPVTVTLGSSEFHAAVAAAIAATQSQG